MHGVVEVGRVLDVAAVDVECVAELFGPRGPVSLHRINVHVHRVCQAIHHVVEVCQKHTPVGLRGTVVERRSLTSELSCPALDLQPVGDHLCG